MVKIMPTKQLTVYRTLMDGRKIRVGELAENKQGIFFAYDENYLSNYPNLSPLSRSIINLNTKKKQICLN